MIGAISTVRPIGAGDTGTSAVGGASQATGGASFSQVLAEVASNTIDNVKSAEATSIAGITGKASVQQVVESVMQAEQSLQTAIAIRDRLVSAYQEISRMAI